MISGLMLMAMVVCGFVGGLIALAAVVESKRGRRWVRELQLRESARARMATDRAQRYPAPPTVVQE